MTIDQLIARVRDQQNTEIARYNQLTDALNSVRASEPVDGAREAELIGQRSHSQTIINSLRDRVAELEKEREADAAIDALQARTMPSEPPTRRTAPADQIRVAHREGSGFLSLRSLADDYRAAAPEWSIRGLVASGSTIAPAAILDESPVDMGKPATSLLDLIPARTVENGEYSYLQQTTRTNNAAPVAISATKPTSVYTLTRKSGTLQVVAHLSEAIHEPWLSDVPSLEQFIRDEMGSGIALALEDEILNGTATAPSLDGVIDAATGTQAYVTSPLVTIRTGLSQFEAAGLKPSAVVLAAADWLAIETATLTAGNYVLGLGSTGAPLDAIRRTVWGVPVVVSAAHTAGTAVLLSEDSVGLVTDGGVTFEWGRVNDDFSKNIVRARAEIRAQVETYRPHGVIVATLTTG